MNYLRLMLCVMAFSFLLVAPTKENCVSINATSQNTYLGTDKFSVLPKEMHATEKQGWYSEAIQNIASKEYFIKKNTAKGCYSSPNRIHGLRSNFTGSIFSLVPRIDTIESWKLQLTINGIYSEKTKLFSPSQSPVVTQLQNQIQFNHNNQFTTEYINSTEGVRQNFIIHQKPKTYTEQVKVKLKVNDGWVINQPHKKEIHFAKQNGNELEKKITYNNLKVWDANKKELDAYFAVNKNEIDIVVDVADAVYPITIDPLSTGTAGTIDWQTSGPDQVGAEFGVSVSSAGDVNGDGYSDVIIGSYLYDDGFSDEGGAFVYHGSATGLSTTPDIVLADADQTFALFGISVATAGDVNGDGYSDVIVGAYYWDDGASVNEGGAFVYHGSATGLSSTPASIANDINQSDAQFGRSVACAGDVNGDGYSDVIIGSWNYDDGANGEEGRALVYYGSAIGIVASPSVTLSDCNQASAFFGIVSGAGDVNGDGFSDVIVTAPWYTDGIYSAEGRGFVYHGSAAGLSTTANSIIDDADQDGAFLGQAVSTAGDVNGDGYSDIVISTPNHDSFEGIAYIYNGSASGIGSSPSITLETNVANARFGSASACAGDVNGDGYSDVMIGATPPSGGRGYIYYGSATGLVNTPNVTLDDANTAQGFGGKVASAGDVNGDGLSDVIISAQNYDAGTNTNEGRAYVYYGSYTGLSTTVNRTIESNQAFAFYGSSVNTAGDVNSDGYSDIIIGAPNFDNGNTDEGAAFVFHGSTTGLSALPNWTTEGNQNWASYGRTVTGVGDINGDGYGDVAVAANLFDGAFVDGGRVFIYQGSAAGLSTTAARTIDGPQASSAFGYALSYAGDVNGDGYSDMIIGAWGIDDATLTDKGMAYVYYGSSTGIPVSANWMYDHGLDGATVGESVAGAGDVNGDGYSDIIVGATYYTNGQAAEGAAFVFHGSAIGLSPIPNRTYEGNQANGSFGVSVNSAGDVNGDGFSDVIIGARLFDAPAADVGRVFIYHGSSIGLPALANTILSGNQTTSFYGQASASAGDVNGDGYSDIFIGAYWFDNGQVNEGRTFLHYGSSAGVSTNVAWTTESNLAGAQYGQVIACAGDVNGDGFSDVIVGAPNFSNGESNEGRVYIYYGNNTGGIRNNIRLYNTDLVTPIQQINYNQPNLFGAGFFAKSPLGRQRGRMVWDAKAKGLPFLGSPINTTTLYGNRQASFFDLGTTGTELKSQILKESFQTKIRTRVEYSKVTALTGQVYGPWRYPAGYTQGFHGMNAVPLPFTLLSFTGNRNEDGTVLLNWNTSNEVNMKQYSVERSVDGVLYKAVGSVEAKGQNKNYYSLIDTDKKSEKLFYRLRAEDENSKVSYSGMIVIKPVKVQWNVFPNPASDAVNITMKNGEIGIIQIISASGQLITRKQIVGGINTVNIRKLMPGIYTLVIESGINKITKQLVKQ